MSTVSSSRPTPARAIPPPGPEEAERFALAELDAFVRLLESLEPPEWQLPTACDLWTVADVVAHQGGHVQSGMGVRGLFAQLDPRLLRPYRRRGLDTLGAMNQAQVEMRRALSPAELLAEVRDRTPLAIAARRRPGWPARLVRVPVPDYGLAPVDYLLRVIFPRDMWIHRLDIADATGRPFTLTPGHDDQLFAHVVRDMERNVRRRLRGLPVRLEVDGPAGGAWRLGRGDEVAVRIGLLDALRLSSGRLPRDQRTAVAEVSTADDGLRERVLEALVAPY